MIRSRGQTWKVQENRAEYVELVRSIAQILDAVQKTLVGESDGDISSRLVKDLSDFKWCVHCLG